MNAPNHQMPTPNGSREAAMPAWRRAWSWGFSPGDPREGAESELKRWLSVARARRSFGRIPARAVCGVLIALALSCVNTAAAAASMETYTAQLLLGDWRPSPDDLVNALDVFKHGYARWEDRAGKVLRRFGEYRFQYYGIRERGRNLVFLNALCSDYWERARNWRERLVVVERGGACFFQAKIDVSLGQIVELVVNAEGKPESKRVMN